MAGTSVLMAPTALMMVHNPLTVAIGDSEEMRKAIGMLSEVKESIINAYETKTGLERTKLSKLMDAETWMSAHKAMELGFSDGILEGAKSGKEPSSYAFSRRAVTNSLLDKVMPMSAKAAYKDAGPPGDTDTNTEPQGTPAESLERRLFLISH
jgi:ATP-dependent Clp protease protease subunit